MPRTIVKHLIEKLTELMDHRPTEDAIRVSKGMLRLLLAALSELMEQNEKLQAQLDAKK